MTMISTQNWLPPINPYTKRSDDVLVIGQSFDKSRKFMIIDHLEEGKDDCFGFFRLSRYYGKVSYWIPVDCDQASLDKWIFDISIQIRARFPDLLD